MGQFFLLHQNLNFLITSNILIVIKEESNPTLKKNMDD